MRSGDAGPLNWGKYNMWELIRGAKEAGARGRDHVHHAEGLHLLVVDLLLPHNVLRGGGASEYPSAPSLVQGSCDGSRGGKKRPVSNPPPSAPY